MEDPLTPEENKRFMELLGKIDIPHDRKQSLEGLSVSAKRQLMIIERPGGPTKDPGEYVMKLKHVIDAGKDYKKARKRSRDVEFLKSLQGLSTSLRTNGLSWVLHFLSKECQGLEVLVQYMQYRYKMESELLHGKPEDQRRHSEVEVADSDLHICVNCMSALVNTSEGFKAVTGHAYAVTCLTQAMFFGTMKTMTTVLELLAALCLVKGGHEKIMAGVDTFKVQHGETYRFQKLVAVFKQNGLDNVQFATTCMTFINIVVNSCEDLNYRMYLQHEFTMMDIDDYLEELEMRGRDYPALQEQIKAYQDNYFDLGILLNDAATKREGFNMATTMEKQLKELQDAHKKAEYQSIKKIAELEKKLYDLKKFIKALHETVPRADKAEEDQLTSTEVPEWLSKDLAVKKRRLTLVPTERLNHMLAQAAKQGRSPDPSFPEESLQAAPLPTPTLPVAAGTVLLPPQSPPPSLPVVSRTVLLSPQSPPPSPPSIDSAHPLHPPPDIVPPPHPGMGSPPPGPPPPPEIPLPPPTKGSAQLPGALDVLSALPPKQRYQPKHRLPQMNWSAIPAAKVEGTIFSELDEENMMQRLKDEIEEFEELFKTKAKEKKVKNRACAEAPNSKGNQQSSKQPPKDQVLETSRIRNVAISLHKVKKTLAQIKAAVLVLDVEQLNPEEVDILMKIAPTADEMKKFKKFLEKKKKISSVSEEEQFMYELGGVARLPVRLKVMNFMHTLEEDMPLLTAQIDALVAASSSLLGCQGLKRVFEMILTFGNYMNSGKRVAAYGFKIQSLDMLLDTRSTDRKMTLLQYIVQLMRERFPEHAEFCDEVLYLKKAGLVSLDQLGADVRAMTETFQLAVGELVKDQDNIQLREFVIATEGKINDLKDRFQMAEDTYHKVVRFYGEDPRTTEPGPFFNEFSRFIAAYKKGERDNDLKQVEVEAAQVSDKMQQAAPVVSQPAAEQLKVLTEAGEGTIDQIISDMKGKVFIAKVRKEGFGGVFTNHPAASMADFAANKSLEPDSDFTRSHPWLCT